MIMVSKCLLGENCKYNGGNNLNKRVVEFLKGKKYVAICPECLGGMSTPRRPSEILRGSRKVFSSAGEDVTDKFLKGAECALDIAKKNNVSLAVLKQSSPSCGFGSIYDGNFSGKKIKGNGITAQLLAENGIEIVTEKDI